MKCRNRILPLLAVSCSLTLGATPVSAGIAESVRDFVQLPGNVRDLQQQYVETKQQLEESMEQAAKAAESLQAAQESMKKALADNEALRQQNEQLNRQNERLQQQLADLQQAEQARKDRNRRIWTASLTAAGLLAGYFAISRILRIVMRSK
ncbi:hypothetical protein ACFQWB_12070 [Paenibacillus thermoaerophilus]|uniref:Uncharacterized protein n=1 Tax=Paenibacillus thermoaerophilus TaxID=1215385 RepID=A0ABW2V5Z6_9BACL|nr:hypothetical protein [Paenibacillus thermoaerophilus]TMV17662.1 hypothetical protein FE781_05890 [Paenibacillus thermoaerophilus]